MIKFFDYRLAWTLFTRTSGWFLVKKVEAIKRISRIKHVCQPTDLNMKINVMDKYARLDFHFFPAFNKFIWAKTFPSINHHMSTNTKSIEIFSLKKNKPSLIYVSSVESFFIHAFINLKLNFPTIEQCSWNEKYKNIHSRWIEIWIARKFWSQCISFQNRVTISHFNKFSENCRSLNEEKSRNFVIKKLI